MGRTWTPCSTGELCSEEDEPEDENGLARIETGQEGLNRKQAARWDVRENGARDANDRRAIGLPARQTAEQSGAALIVGGMLKGRSPRHGTHRAMQKTLLISCGVMDKNAAGWGAGEDDRET